MTSMALHVCCGVLQCVSLYALFGAVCVWQCVVYIYSRYQWHHDTCQGMQSKCNVMVCIATHCNTLQHTHTRICTVDINYITTSMSWYAVKVQRHGTHLKCISTWTRSLICKHMSGRRCDCHRAPDQKLLQDLCNPNSEEISEFCGFLNQHVSQTIFFKGTTWWARHLAFFLYVLHSDLRWAGM